MKWLYRIALVLLLCIHGVWAATPMPTQTGLLSEKQSKQYWQSSLSGGPGKDGIPSIDRPRFLSAAQGDEMLQTDDIIMGIYHNGQARAYPQKILVWHEIVNDTIANDNIALTYCPLTGTAIGFLRGSAEFGVSGLLVNSNVLMYDRSTGTHWSQIAATGVYGSLRGQGLQEIRVVWTTWKHWKARYPNTEVLSLRTGYARNYRQDAYGSYRPKAGYYAEKSNPIFPVMHESRLYSPKTEIFGFRTQTEAVAVDKTVLALKKIMRYEGVEQDFLIIHDEALNTAWVLQGKKGQLPAKLAISEIRFSATGPQSDALQGLLPVNGFDAFWFAWYAFYPNTVILNDKK